MIRPYRSTLLAGLLAILFIPAIASAQTVVGVKGGVTFSTVDFKIEGVEDAFVPQFDTKAGATAGVFVGRDFTSVLGLQVEALYTQKTTGSKDFDVVGVPVDAKFRLDYLEIPVLVTAKLGGNDQAAFRVYGGPSFAFKLNDKIEFDGVESDEDPGLKSQDAGVVVGASVTAGHLVFEGRYTHGLLNIEDEEPDTLKVKTRSFAFLVGWSF